jgi:hypothetical protein
MKTSDRLIDEVVSGNSPEVTLESWMTHYASGDPNDLKQVIGKFKLGQRVEYPWQHGGKSFLYRGIVRVIDDHGIKIDNDHMFDYSKKKWVAPINHLSYENPSNVHPIGGYFKDDKVYPEDKKLGY